MAELHDIQPIPIEEFAPRRGIASAAASASSGALPPAVRNEKPPYKWISPSHPLGPHYTDAQLKKYGATADEIWIIGHESTGWSHAWNYAFQTSSGYAFGLGQITGLFRYNNFRSQWESDDPRVQIKMMQAYIRHGSPHFHDDAGAIAWWKVHKWY